MTRVPVCASLVAHTMPSSLLDAEFRICPGIDRPYRLAIVAGDDFDVISEHHTPRQAQDARDEARAAAADALIALSEIGRVSQ